MAAVHERYCDWVALRRQQLWCHFIAFTRATRVLASHAGDFGANLHSSIHLNGSITDVLPRGNGRCSQEINQPSSTFSSRSEESNHWKWNMKTNHFKLRVMQKAYRLLWKASMLMNERFDVGLVDVLFMQVLSLLYQGYTLRRRLIHVGK